MAVDEHPKHPSESRQAGGNDGLACENRSERSHGTNGFRLPTWLIPVAAFVVAILVVATIATLVSYARQSKDAQIVIAQLQETVVQQQLAEFEAITEGEITSEVTDK